MSHTLREAIDKVVEHTRRDQRDPRMPVDRALQYVRANLTQPDIRRLTADPDLRLAYLEVIAVSDGEIAGALRG